MRDRDVAGRHDGFIAEGEVVLAHWLRNGGRPQSVLLAAKRTAKLAPLLELLPPETPVYLAAQSVMDALVGFPIHRGVLALGRRSPAPTLEGWLASAPERALVVALFGVANHDNMGGVFRNAAAFAADAVLLSPDCCDPLYRKAIRVSVGAALTVPFLRAARAAALLDGLSAAGFEMIALAPGGRESLGRVAPGPRAALLLGAEGPGLPQEVLSRVGSVHIPMSGRIDSLNLAVSSGIALNHLRSRC